MIQTGHPRRAPLSNCFVRGSSSDKKRMPAILCCFRVLAVGWPVHVLQCSLGEVAFPRYRRCIRLSNRTQRVASLLLQGVLGRIDRCMSCGVPHVSPAFPLGGAHAFSAGPSCSAVVAPGCSRPAGPVHVLRCSACLSGVPSRRCIRLFQLYLRVVPSLLQGARGPLGRCMSCRASSFVRRSFLKVHAPFQWHLRVVPSSL